MAIKITAVTSKGMAIASVHVHPDETLDTVIQIMTTKLTTSSLNEIYPLLDAWVNGGRTIKVEV